MKSDGMIESQVQQVSRVKAFITVFFSVCSLQKQCRNRRHAKRNGCENNKTEGAAWLIDCPVDQLINK